MAVPKGIFDSQGNVRDYRKSFPIILENAEDGDTFAQSLAGYCYLEGLGVK